MFAYCRNNPIRNSDPYGCASKICFGDYVNPLGFPWQDPMGGGGNGYAIVFAYHYADDLEDSGCLEDREKTMFGGTRHTQILPWEFSFFDISDEGITLVDASVSLAKVAFDWDFLDLSIVPYDAFTVAISAGLNSENGLHASAIAYMLKPSVSVNIFGVNVTAFAYIGSVGAEFVFNPAGEFTFGIAPKGYGGGISIAWDT